MLIFQENKSEGDKFNGQKAHLVSFIVVLNNPGTLKFEIILMIFSYNS